MSVQRPLTVILKVKAAESAALRTLLTDIGTDIERNPHLQFRKSRSTHFARFVLLDEDTRLLFISNYDGDEDAYYAELGETLGDGLKEILCRCEGMPAQSASFADDFVPRLRKSSSQPQTFFVAFPGKSVKEIARCEAARMSVDAMLDRLSVVLQSPARQTPVPTPEPSQVLSFASGPPSQLRWWERLFEWLVGIRAASEPSPNATTSQGLTAVEDLVVQNQMTVIVGIKSSRWSRFLLRVVLFATNRIARGSNGSLSGISTIHFARWAIIDDGTKLLFESNYDGSWERYIDDFVDRASVGLNAIWGNCEGYPLGGARDIEAFKKSIRDHQHPAQVFYSAYPQSTVINIWNDLRFGEVVAQGLPGVSFAISNGAPVYPA